MLYGKGIARAMLAISSALLLVASPAMAGHNGQEENGATERIGRVIGAEIPEAWSIQETCLPKNDVFALGLGPEDDPVAYLVVEHVPAQEDDPNSHEVISVYTEVDWSEPGFQHPRCPGWSDRHIQSIEYTYAAETIQDIMEVLCYLFPENAVCQLIVETSVAAADYLSDNYDVVETELRGQLRPTAEPVLGEQMASIIFDDVAPPMRDDFRCWWAAIAAGVILGFFTGGAGGYAGFASTYVVWGILAA